MIITFCRLRPAGAITELTVSARRREGTTVIESHSLTAAGALCAARGGVLPVAHSVAEPGVAVAGWVLDPTAAVVNTNLEGWRLTIDAGSTRRETILDAVARSSSAFLRSPRSRVPELAAIASLPGLTTSISVFVDDVEQAVAAVEAGATDLLLRDWDNEGLAELRQAVGPAILIERTAFPLNRPIDEVRDALSADLFTAWLHQVDGSGAVRPRVEWAPGRDVPVPVPPARISAQWTDPVWTAGRAPSQLDGAGPLHRILEASLAGTAPVRDEVELLFGARGDQVDAVAWTADQLRRRSVGDTVTYVINRNINYTNQCYFRCGFCAFSKGPRSLNLREEPYLIPLEGIVGLAQEAWERGATEVTLQGGIHPQFTGDFYAEVVEAIKARLPEMHIHGFTPLEIWQGAETLGVPVREFLRRLAAAGLGSLPGTAAEVLDDEIRVFLCPDKIRTAQWAEVMIAAHEIGLRATATLMFGHIDHPRAWANHLEVIRAIQRRTGGFTEFVPLPFVHMGAPIYLRGQSRPGPTWDEVVLVHAVARIAFDGLIPNVQASWVKLGLDGGARLLDAGCNDLGGTLMGEIITRSAGAAHGQEVTPDEFVDTIRAAGRTPARRSTTYQLLERV
ncbi:MAG TPA: 5-amino-6-(D-ribitylamino)uracil--L-tyrosine 4-hydroxyphenyl transferase CofH [Acidimicrobiia bacterium]|nr:5-amino-6-(D-ribitylamino)uracil--L-tyrosine 4-hydroxyphenyl transferase CofH [Acidimicrobiia bacterium]